MLVPTNKDIDQFSASVKNGKIFEFCIDINDLRKETVVIMLELKT